MIDISTELEKLEICKTCEHTCNTNGVPTCQIESRPIIVIVSNNQACPAGKWQ
jgi:hypothetical protein